MSNSDFDFQKRAREVMIEDRFEPDIPPQALAEAKAAKPADLSTTDRVDLRGLLWSSIDNTTSRDLDQIEWAEALPDNRIRVRVGVADVSATITPDSACDQHARRNATSVYSGGPVFPMLPERFSTDLTSLGPDVDRPALVMEFVVDKNGDVVCAEVSAALVRNKAQLNYDQVGKWLQGKVPSPNGGEVSSELQAQLKLQSEAGARLKKFRKE